MAAAVAACDRPRRRRELNTRPRHPHCIADPLRVPRNPHAIDGFARPREILLAA